jgi:hypothetical protein
MAEALIQQVTTNEKRHSRHCELNLDWLLSKSFSRDYEE